MYKTVSPVADREPFEPVDKWLLYSIRCPQDCDIVYVQILFPCCGLSGLAGFGCEEEDKTDTRAFITHSGTCMISSAASV